jgi:hypothetical protein
VARDLIPVAVVLGACLACLVAVQVAHRVLLRLGRRFRPLRELAAAVTDRSSYWSSFVRWTSGCAGTA